MKTNITPSIRLKKASLSDQTRLLILDGVAMLYIFVLLCILYSQYSNSDRFFEQLFNSEITEAHPGRWLKGILTVESVIILLLIYPRSRKGALIAGMALFFAYTAYYVYISRYTDGVTYKFGILSGHHWYQSTTLHLSLIGLACLSLLINGAKKPKTSFVNDVKTHSVLTN